MRGLGSMRGAMMQGMGGGMRGGMGGMGGGMGGMGGMGGGMGGMGGKKTSPLLFIALFMVGCAIGCSCMAAVCKFGFFNQQPSAPTPQKRRKFR